MRKLSRRSALSALAAAGSTVYARGKATAFALIGDRYHNSDYIRTALSKTLSHGTGLSIDFRDEVALLNADELKGYRLLIVFRDGMLWPDGYSQRPPCAPEVTSKPPVPMLDSEPLYWITAAQGKAVKDFVSRGGGVLFYHNVTYISPHNDDFRDVLGAVTLQHPPLRPFKVKVTNKEHPITEGVQDFVVTDEQHFMEYQKDRRHLLLESVNEDGLTHKTFGATAPAGWAYDYGKGRVCYLAPGHVISALWNPEYVKLQQNAVKWLLRQS